MSSQSTFCRFAVASVIVLSLPAASRAQISAKSSGGTTALARAIELHDAAVSLYSQPNRAADAAKLHLQEVAFRSERDPEAIESLFMAAHLFNNAKRPIDARRTMVKAADRAIAIGDVARAAQGYLDAAFMAQKSANDAEVQRLGRKAALLTESPLLQQAQRNAIRSRIKSSSALASLID